MKPQTPEFHVLCPNCGGEQYCPCPSCRERHGQEIVWKWVTGNGPVACGHCGHIMSTDEWDMVEYKQYEKWLVEKGV